MLHIVFPRILSPKMHEKNIAPVIVCIPFHLTDCLLESEIRVQFFRLRSNKIHRGKTREFVEVK